VTRRSRSQPQLDLRSSTPPPPSTDDASAADAADDDDDDSRQNRVDKPASSTRTICYSARPDPTRPDNTVASRRVGRCEFSRAKTKNFLSRDKAIAYQQAGTLTNKLIIQGARASQATVRHSLNNLVFVVYVYAFVEQR